MDEKAKELLDHMNSAVRKNGCGSIDRLLSLLSTQEEEIVRLRHGFGRPRIGTYRELGERVGLSRSRVAQVHDRAFRRLRWFIQDGGSVGSAALAAYAVQKRQQAAEEARFEKLRDEEKLVEAERKRNEKLARAEIRRAESRRNHWQRKLDRTRKNLESLQKSLCAVDHRIMKLERRGWLMRTLLLHSSSLDKLRRERETLDANVRNIEDTLRDLLSVERE